jgi:itaconyl-CoA hydratase
MSTFEPAAFPIAVKGNKFEDFAVGRRFAHHWGRTVTDADNVVFSTALCNWNPMHLNAEYAKAHGYKDVVVNPMLVLCIAVGMSVEDLSEAGGPFLGVDDCAFRIAVHPGDTIRAVSEVLDVRTSDSRPSDGIVTWKTDVYNQRDELVADFRRTNLVARRTPPT